MTLSSSELPPSAQELLRDLSPEDRGLVLQMAQILRVPRGKVLVHQGEPADCVYFVLRGKFEVLRDRSRVLAEIGPGEPIGEIAFFAGLTRTADVTATRDSDVMSLDRDAYAELSRRVPAFTQAILRSFGRRLAAATSTAPALAPRAPGTIGICQAGATPMPERLVRQLCAALGQSGHAAPIGFRDLPADRDPSQSAAVSDWLAMRERAQGRLLLITGEGNADWDRTALSQCDFLLLIGAADEGHAGPVALGALETFALPLFRQEHVSLLLWRESQSDPIRETANWLGPRAPHLHHHLALDNPGDLARLVRFLNGTALGAVFGGGGALGAGHIGVLRALFDAGAVFDLFGGTSIGSSIAIEMARNPVMAGKLDVFEEFFLKRRSLSKLNIPLYSVFDHSHFDTELRVEFGKNRLEDLPLNAFAVATSLSTNEIVVLRQGLCWQAVRASAAIPAVLPPFVTETGDVLVDGAIIDNVPTAVMRQLKPGPNIAVILSPDEDWRVRSAYENLPSRRRLAGQIVLRRHSATDFPKIMEVVGRAMMVTSSRTLRQPAHPDDLLLMPPSVPGMGLLDWKSVRAQEAAAYEFTLRRLDAAGGLAGLLAGPAPKDPNE
ncbi:patatin-like phospholipase family protein [Paracoccus aminophilus]|uniref:Cyclic nucleotide-binding protein n=1 Tax=Paracoccus aminophilus JCM 7686 TaxID=1367847 RepID=S5Y0Y8_PARAH|nr:cyclic nucleotide-binding and patatin-like phospholipase domain-containing protein [Paracoccus aminophilus]AGT11162.1 cyclic nucleotide-binding protein [Paracoccus aminophilus JCM 7686]